jgi:hypothetical protein
MFATAAVIPAQFTAFKTRRIEKSHRHMCCETDHTQTEFLIFDLTKALQIAACIRDNRLDNVARLNVRLVLD